jgi:hypothetical protein
MKSAHKIQEWLADRVSWVQYPNIRAADASTRAASRSGARFENQMTLGQRLDLVILSGGLLVAGLGALATACAFLYLLITSA